MESLDLHSANRTCDSLRCYGWEVMDLTPCKTGFAPTDFRLFWAPIGKRFATNADMKQAVWNWLFLPWVKNPGARWDKCWMWMAKTQKSGVLHLLLIRHTQCIELRTNSQQQSFTLLFKESVSWLLIFLMILSYIKYHRNNYKLWS